MFCWSLFVLLYFIFWPLCCLFFDIRILIGIFKLFLHCCSQLLSSPSYRCIVCNTFWSDNIIDLQFCSFRCRITRVLVNLSHVQFVPIFCQFVPTVIYQCG
jgi:hypothetical protein